MKEFTQQFIFGNPVKAWLIAFAIAAACMIACRLFQSIVISRIKRISGRTQTTVDDFAVLVLQRSAMPLLYIVSLYAGIHYLWIDEKVKRIINIATLVAAVFFITRAIVDVIGYLLQSFAAKRNETQTRQAKGLLLIARIIIWIAAIIFLADNLGYNITTIITGLGIGGIAIALAAQTILGDLFGYFVIFFDKPFETGDFITVGEMSGSVEYVGVKTTRLRALSGEQLIVSNSNLTNSKIQNYKRMDKRRVVFSIGVVYETSADTLKKIPALLKQVVESHADIQFDRAHFSGFGDFSLKFEVVYYILTADYNLYMDRQQSIYLGIVEKFAAEQIGFAYPTQTILLPGQKKQENQDIKNPGAMVHS